MFRFEHPYYLYALGLIPILILLYVLYAIWRRSALQRFGENPLVAQLSPGVSKYKRGIKFSLLLLAFVFLVVGWANPQWGSKRDKVKRKSVDVLIALDISNSMYAEDIAPNRMERAKKFAENLVEKLKGDRIGLILFAGGAYLQMPITTDYAAAELFIRSASPDLAGTQGTAIADAINLARRNFVNDDKSHKALVIITDGEDHDGEALEAAAQAREVGLIQFTVGVGTTEGAFIPMTIGGRQDYKRDRNGQPVRSRLNEEMMKELAAKGGGDYFPISQGEGVASALQKQIDLLEKKELEVRAFTSYESYFQYFLGAAMLLLLLEFVISYRREKWLEGKDIFK